MANKETTTTKKNSKPQGCSRRQTHCLINNSLELAAEGGVHNSTAPKTNYIVMRVRTDLNHLYLLVVLDAIRRCQITLVRNSTSHIAISVSFQNNEQQQNKRTNERTTAAARKNSHQYIN